MKNIKKFLSVLLSACMILMPSLNVYADSAYQNSSELVDYQISENEKFTNTTNVYAQIEEDFLVTIPKTIVLDGVEKSASYEVSVLGDIAGTSLIYVVPDKTFALREESGNKDSITASITQDKKTWSFNEMISPNNEVASGLITAQDLTAGHWLGSFNFNILLGATNADGSEVDPYNPTLQVLDEVNILQTSNEIELFDGQTNRLNITYNGINVTDDATYVSDSEVITVNQEGIVNTSNTQPGDEANITVTYSVPASAVLEYQTVVHIVVKECTHVFDILVEKIEPNCTNAGYEIYKCSVCGVEKYNKTVEIPANGHTSKAPVQENVINASCNTTGSYDSVVYCDVCNAKLSSTPTTIPELGHEFVNGFCVRCSIPQFTSKDFAYTGTVQAFTVPITGLYKLEVWGAQGRQGESARPGYGGYSVGYKKLNAGEVIYICVGGQGGGSGRYGGTLSIGVGGYNGGGTSNANYGGYTGGGATHMAKVTGTLASIGYDSFVTQGNGLIVAGGGGASHQSYGGDGGGTSGNTALNWSNAVISAGTQTSGAGFGQGQNNYGAPDDWDGGGGGLYGGYGSNLRGGAGGSGYIGGVPSITYKGTTYSPSMQVGGNSGNGKAKITFVTQ